MIQDLRKKLNLFLKCGLIVFVILYQSHKICNNNNMSDTKMLQTILDKVSTLDRKVDDGFKKVDQRFDKTEKRLTKRIDKLGLQIASLEDDLPAIAALQRWPAGAPTIEEFDNLEKRVTKLEKHPASV